MSGREYVVILFAGTSHAVRAESLLVRAGVDCRLVPVPRQLSSDCGVCVRLEPADEERALEVLAGAGLEIEGVHTLS